MITQRGGVSPRSIGSSTQRSGGSTRSRGIGPVAGGVGAGCCAIQRRERRGADRRTRQGAIVVGNNDARARADEIGNGGLGVCRAENDLIGAGGACIGTNSRRICVCGARKRA